MEIESESMKLQFHIMIVPVVTKSGDKVSKYFGISKYTLYSYIDAKKE